MNQRFQVIETRHGVLHSLERSLLVLQPSPDALVAETFGPLEALFHASGQRKSIVRTCFFWSEHDKVVEKKVQNSKEGQSNAITWN